MQHASSATYIEQFFEAMLYSPTRILCRNLIVTRVAMPAMISEMLMLRLWRYLHLLESVGDPWQWASDGTLRISLRATEE